MGAEGREVGRGTVRRPGGEPDDRRGDGAAARRGLTSCVPASATPPSGARSRSGRRTRWTRRAGPSAGPRASCGPWARRPTAGRARRRAPRGSRVEQRVADVGRGRDAVQDDAEDLRVDPGAGLAAKADVPRRRLELASMTRRVPSTNARQDRRVGHDPERRAVDDQDVLAGLQALEDRQHPLRPEHLGRVGGSSPEVRTLRRSCSFVWAIARCRCSCGRGSALRAAPARAPSWPAA